MASAVSCVFKKGMKRNIAMPLFRKYSLSVDVIRNRGTLILGGAFVASASFYWYIRSSKLQAQVEPDPKKSASCTVCDLSENAGTHNIPPIKLFQYETCPFCNKVRAFLDYYDIQYTKVEVNPLFKKEIKFSSSKHVPFAMVGDTQVCDSSLIISVLQSCVVGTGTVEDTLNLYPQVHFTDAKGKERVERANKYFIMFGDTKQIDERREERQWRQWVDDTLVHTLAPNIYRTPREALMAMEYISSVGNFSSVERVAAKYAGAIAMYFLGKRLKKRHNLKEDVRESLYDCTYQWLEAVGPNRRYLGGSTPNLADLAVYGVLHGIEGQPAFDDLLKRTKISPWYNAMKKEVKEHNGKKTLVSSS